MKKLISIIFTMLACFIFVGSVHAAANVNITGLTVEDKTSTIDVNSYSYEGLGIKTDIFFNKMGDYVKFKVTLKNNDNIDYIISDIQSNYQNEYTEVKYEYENNTKEFKANSSKVLFVTFRYTKEATNVTTLNGSEIKLTIPLDTLSNPKTGPDKAVTILLVGLALGFLLFMYTRKVEIALSVFLAVSVFGGTIYLVEAAQELRIDINVVVTMDAPTTGKAKFDVGQAVAAKMFTMADMSYSIEEDGIYMTCYNEENEGLPSGTPQLSTNNYSQFTKKLSDKEAADEFPSFDNDPVSDNMYTCTDHILNIVRSKTIDNQYKNEEHKVSAADSEIPIYMWYEASNKTIYWYTEAPIAYLNEDASQMFAYLEYLNTLDLSDIRTRYTTNMARLFGYDRSLTKLDLSNFDTSNVTDMSQMFFNMKKLESIDVSGFDTSNVEKALGMFFNNRSLTSLDLSDWNTSKLIDINGFIGYNYNLKELDISSLKIVPETNVMGLELNSCINLERIKTPSIFNVESNKKFTLPAVFTDGTNYYSILDNSTPTSTWIERTDKNIAILFDNVNCVLPKAVNAGYNCEVGHSYINYIEFDDNMTWNDWINSNYNKIGLSFVNECSEDNNPVIVLENAIDNDSVLLEDKIIKENRYYLSKDNCDEK